MTHLVHSPLGHIENAQGGLVLFRTFHPNGKIAATHLLHYFGEIERLFPSRSRIIEDALQEKLTRMTHNRLARECAKLDLEFEKASAEEGMEKELRKCPGYREATSTWPTSTRYAITSLYPSLLMADLSRECENFNNVFAFLQL